MLNMPGIILVDDNQEELTDIQNAFFNAGIPCLPVQYKETGISHIDFSRLTPRVIITDINLENQSSLDAKRLVGPIAEIIQNVVKKGPYILYFWSKLTEEVEEIMQLLETRFKDNLEMPIHYGRIEKSNFRGSENADALAKLVQEITSKDPLFSAMFDWENRVARAASETTEILYNLTKPLTPTEGVSTNTVHLQELRKALALIGNETLGKKNAKDFPNEALDAGLAPVLYDRLKAKLSTSSKWKEAVPNIGDEVIVSPDVKAALNSFYHIEPVGPEFSKSCRGIFVELASGITQNAKFQQQLGIDTAQLLHEEFLSTSKLGKPSAEADAFKEQARNGTILGFVELSAECDHAQKKTKLHRYALAALIPSDFEALTEFKRGDVISKTAHAGIYRLPNILICSKIYILKISFKYQIGTKPVVNLGQQEYTHKWFGEPKFRLKDQILSEISFLSAQYSSRPGIVRFD